MKKIKKFKNPRKKRFIIEMNEDIDRTVDKALSLIENGRLDQGAAILQRLTAEHPGYHFVQYGMGVVYALTKKYDDAILCFKKAVEIFPHFIDAQFNLAVTYQKKLDVGNTIRAYQKVVAMGAPGDPLVVQARDFLSGMEECVRKNDGVGLDVYLKGMDKFEKAFAKMEKQEWPAAIEGFKECLAIVKRNFQSYGNMGICYAKLGKKEQALASFDKALELNPRYEIAAVNRALTLNLREGEKLPDGTVESVDFSRDYAHKKRSYISELTEAVKRKWNE